MKICRIATALFIAAVVGLSASVARADDTATIEGVTIGSADNKQLIDALHVALDPNDKSIHFVVDLKKPAEMPGYDPIWHYAGSAPDATGKSQMTIWLNSDLSSDAMQKSLAAAFLVALCDGGYGGPNFKKLYDIYAAKDATLPANTPDPYVNRRKFATAMQKILYP